MSARLHARGPATGRAAGAIRQAVGRELGTVITDEGAGATACHSGRGVVAVGFAAPWE
jgi:hypothetical protein